MAAVGDIVREEGFRGLGVNAVSARAGVSKVLVYRYFDGLDGLVEAWALQNNYWGGESSADLDEAKRASMDARALAAEFLGGQIASLRASPERREILRWFLSERNPLGSRVMARIEENGRRVQAWIAGRTRKDRDAEASLAIIVGGIYYLSLLADRAPVFNGVDLGSDGGWDRIARAAVSLAAGLARGEGD